MNATADWTGRGFAHEAFVFDGPDALGERVVPFLEDALVRNEPVVVVVAASTAEFLRSQFGTKVQRFAVFEEAERWWRGDAYRTLSAYADAMAPLMGASRPWRLVGEPVWLAYPRGDHWSRLESACNDSFDNLPYYSLCIHDRRRLDAGTLDHVARTHPNSWTDGRVVADPRFESPGSYLRSVEAPWFERPRGRGTSATVLSAAEARACVARDAARLVPDLDAVTLVASELASNALAVSPECRISSWMQDRNLVVEVADHGPGFDAALAGYVPPLPDQPRGRGLWAARQLTSELSVRSTDSGTVVRALFPTSP